MATVDKNKPSLDNSMFLEGIEKLIPEGGNLPPIQPPSTSNRMAIGFKPPSRHKLKL